MFFGGSVSPDTGATVDAVFNDSSTLLKLVGQNYGGAAVAGLWWRPR